jgi:formate C-acetyltransferase
MEIGKDCHQGGARYNSYGATAVGLPTIADSLTTIKYMCFDKKICSTRELFDAYMADWVGYEDLQQRVLTEVPHYGNDDPYADEEMTWIVDTYIELCSEISSWRTDKYKPGMYSAADHISQGHFTWATPDGRKTGTPIADAASPGQGRDVSGPIAVLNSANCFDQSCIQNGLALNLKFHPSALQGDGREKLVQMTQAYFDNGGAELQFNVVGSEVMRKAQEHPDDYRDLVVRIAGYSAYFVELPIGLQNDLISRQEHMAV